MNTGNKLTTKTIAQIALDPKYRNLQKLVLNCRQEAAKTRQLVLAYSEPLFLSYGFRDAVTQELIMESKYLYIAISEENDLEAIFADYYTELHDLHIMNGFEVAEVGCCPALKAENAQTKAENNLLEYMQEKLDMPEIVDIDDQERAIKLYLSLDTL